MSNENMSNVTLSERHMNPEVLAAMQKRENYTWAGVLAILTTILFVTLIALQWIDFSKLSVA